MTTSQDMLELYRLRLEALGPQTADESPAATVERRRVSSRITELLGQLAGELPQPKPRQDID